MKTEPLTLPESPVEQGCRWASGAAILIMLLLLGVDIVTRWLVTYSFEVSDEIGGYMVVAITFLSLSVCQVSGSFHEVEFVQARLSPRAHALSHALFDCLSLGFAALLLWHYGKLLAVRRARADLPGDRAVDSAPADGDRHRGARLCAVPHAHCAPAPGSVSGAPRMTVWGSSCSS